MVSAACEGHHIGKTGRWGTLALRVVSPQRDRAIALYGEAVELSGGDGDDIGERGRNDRLSSKRSCRVCILAPGDNRAIGLQGQGVVAASSNGDHVRES